MHQADPKMQVCFIEASNCHSLVAHSVFEDSRRVPRDQNIYDVIALPHHLF